ncbi:hypothetical protein [Glycomyces tenuis]|uniref:hypothetical protein n=1 Tax=Glycomyces tenuis TaxID=58116 RepID=UPI0004251A26|nr:hypothetical protein [Glycomyces tenuis]
MTALFTAVSAVCATGLAVVDTAAYCSGCGAVVITVLIRIGGFGLEADSLMRFVTDPVITLRSRSVRW